MLWQYGLAGSTCGSEGLSTTIGTSQLSAGLFSDREQEHCSVGPTKRFIPFAKEEIEQSIPDRFQQQARNHPDRIAVKGPIHTFTYDALNRYANRVGRAILALRGTGVETIGVVLEKDAPMIAALLGVLKVGKVYVPLDPTHPGGRATQILEDAQASLIITDNRNLAAVRELAQMTRGVLNIDEMAANFSEDNIGLSNVPDTLAYIIYTSGSTGEPKGVVQNHRNVLHNIMRHTNSLKICIDDRLSLLAPCSTNQAMTDIYCALLNGATLCPFNVKEEGLARLADWLRQEEVTIYHSSPSIFRYLVDAFRSGEAYPSIRLIRLGGEQVFKRDVERYKQHFSATCVLVNSLSSTEAGTLREIFIDKETSIDQSVVPVGFPVDDMEILLLDDASQPVGFNASGQIVIKSRYLVPGYWCRPELTREAFLSSPEGGDARFFRTGDIGRMTPDGCLEYLGRKDLQVKIRGHRVEVAEVEAALLGLAEISQAAVVVREDKQGGMNLVAYVVPVGNSAPSVALLRTSLRDKLPDHMIPSALVMTMTLPLTPSGKLDRKSLPSVARLETGRDASYVRPRTPLECQIVQIWEELLDARPIGVRDDFFEQGGDSLLALRMIDLIEQVCGTDLSPAALLARPTVEHLASALLQADGDKFRSPLTEIQTGGSNQPFFFLHGDWNGGYYCRKLAHHLGKEQPFYAVHPHGLDGQPIPHTIEAMAADRLSSLLKFRPKGPYLLGGHCNGGLIAFEMARQLERMGLRVDLLIIMDAPVLNVHFRWLRRLVACLGFVLRLDRDQQVNSFRRLRMFFIRLRELSHKGTRAEVSFVLGKIKAIVGRVLSSVKGRPLMETCPPSVSNPRNKHFRYLTAYRSAIEGYVPGRYKGRVVFFRSNSMQSQSPVDPAAGWGRVAKDVEVHRLPGEHHSSLTEHVETLAEHLASCLRASNAEHAKVRPASVVDEHLRQLLRELEDRGRENDARETNLARKMLNLRPESAQLISILARSSGVTRVLEIGTSNGYSTIWLAWSVMPAEGRVTSVDNDPAKQAMAHENLGRAGLLDRVDLRLGDATAIVSELPGPFDLVFFDAKPSVPAQLLPLLVPKLAARALLFADNALSHPNEIADYLKLINGLQEFRHMVLPVGKGLSFAYRG
jgi:amino acid adenylation domain-containing protein